MSSRLVEQRREVGHIFFFSKVPGRDKNILLLY